MGENREETYKGLPYSPRFFALANAGVLQHCATSAPTYPPTFSHLMAVSAQNAPKAVPCQSTADNAPSVRKSNQITLRHRFNAELSQCLFDFVIQLLPTAEELAVKEDVRKLLERLIRTIEPDSRLLSFGSTANGFSLRNSDMDLCCLIDSDERLAASDLVTMLGDLLERETKFHVKPLPHARIPIVKLSLDPSPGLPLGIACDIGFENRLALENTRLLYCYAMIDPTRVRTMVLFLKVWCKRRKINSPYKGTLSSYGYVLLVIFFLVHVKNPPVLPNLQQMPPLRPISPAETHIGGHNTWFFDDIELLRQRWQSANTESVGQLLSDFFKYYSRDFLYNTGVASIRAGLLKKESKGWQNDLDPSRFKDSRERNRFCIEDPFEIDFNVARCVTKDGLYTIRGEFMRAARILSIRPDRAILAIAQLCEERADTLGPASSSSNFGMPPRLAPFPPQTPYTVGSSPMRPNEIHMPMPSRASPPSRSADKSARVPQAVAVPVASPSTATPDHMAPRRAKWTSPPPPTAPLADHTSFENRLGLGLALATAPTDARQEDTGYASSSNASEIVTDDEHFDGDDVRSVQSVQSITSEDPDPRSSRIRRSPVAESLPSSSPSVPYHPHFVPINLPPRMINDLNLQASVRGRQWTRLAESYSPPSPIPVVARRLERLATSSRMNSPRRSLSGPPGTSKNSPVPSSYVPLALITPLPPSPAELSPSPSCMPHVYYETYGTRDPIPQPSVVYSYPSIPSSHHVSQPHSPITPAYPSGDLPPVIPASASLKRRSKPPQPDTEPPFKVVVPSPSSTPTTHTQFASSTPSSHMPSHSHTYSSTTIGARTPPPTTPRFINTLDRYLSPSRSTSRSPTQPTLFPGEDQTHSARSFRSTSPPESTSAGSGSPAPSSIGSQFDNSASPLSTSPSSPTQNIEFVKYSTRTLSSLEEEAQKPSTGERELASEVTNVTVASPSEEDALASVTETLALENSP